jgi:hypothetical protein
MSDAAGPEPDQSSPPPAIEKEPMEIHKPHAAKTWREFFIELGTIVLGILIALSLEQAVEGWREHRHYLEARDAMRTELANNIVNLGFRSAISTCVQKRLTEIGDILDKADNGQGFVPPKWIGTASSQRVRFAAEPDAARSDLFSPAEQRQFSYVYSFLHSIDLEQDLERQAWGRLRALEGRSRVAPEMIANLREAVGQASYEDERILFLFGFVKGVAEPLSLHIAPIDSSVSRVLPKVWPTCLPMNTPREEAIRRSAYRNIPRLTEMTDQPQ